MNKPRRIRIYKLSTFDTLTEEERTLHDAYQNASKNKAELKEERDNKISSFKGTRRIERNKLYRYEIDKDNKEKEIGIENTDKQIALFESEMARYATDFKEEFPLVMEIVYLKIAHQNEIFKQILNRGLLIDDEKYIFYSSTTNQLKRGEIILVQESFYEKNKSKFMCGLTDNEINNKGGCNRGKYLAYKGLPLSTSFIPEEYEINIKKCLLVPDFETTVNKMVECIDIDHNKQEIINIERRMEDVNIPQTDGAGMFLPGVLPSSAQIRCAHLKGAIFPFDFIKFLTQDEVEGVKPSPIIKDAWGIEHDVIEEDIQVILTSSQLKMWKYYDSWDDFKKAFEDNNMKIAINKFADTEPKGYVKTSYQFIQTLSSEKLTDEMIEKLCEDTIEYLSNMKQDLNTMIDIIGNKGDYLSMTLEKYNELRQDKYVQDKIEDKFKSERTDARGNKLILKDSLYSYICPDLYAFCTWLFCGIEKSKGLVPDNYVYNSFFNDKDYTEVDCLRSPHLYIEHGIRKLVQGKELERCKEWFNDLDTIVSSHDLLCRMLMFDVDGDEILLTPNKYIIDCVPDDVVPLFYKTFPVEKHAIENEEIYNAVIASIENSNIGDISNVMTKNYNNDETDMEFNKIMCCYNNLTIDFPKTQKNIILGKYQKKYDKLLREKNPYFFIYAKKKKVANCKKPSNSNADRICRYIHRMTANKRYEWKDNDKKFDPSVLFDKNSKVDVRDEKYSNLESLMFELRKRESFLISNIDKATKELNKSDKISEKVGRYDVFFHMCEKMITKIFNNNRKEASDYLLDLEYLQRENENKSKDILWNCFGDLIYKNVCENLQNGEIRKRRKHYQISKSELRIVENKVVDLIKDSAEYKIDILQEEIEWLNNLPYKKDCERDRDLLYVLLVLSKRYNGKFRIYFNQKKRLTSSKINKWLGKDVCICKKGLPRLEKIDAISIDRKKNSYEISVNVPKFDEPTTKAFVINQKNPMIAFYKNNGEKSVEECSICGRDFIKTGNTMTCSVVCSKEQERRRKRRWTDKSA